MSILPSRGDRPAIAHARPRTHRKRPPRSVSARVVSILDRESHPDEWPDWIADQTFTATEDDRWTITGGN